MVFSEAIRSCFSQYATFSGRARRSEFWYFILFTILGSFVLGMLESLAFGWSLVGPGGLSTLFDLVVLLPSISVAVRRLHDLGKSGWWWWLWLIPIVGWIILLIWYCTKGTFGSNRFGPDPFGHDENQDDEVFDHKSSIPSVARKN
ncbi:MAG: DUF805 domain-containing protein [Paracoccaceae bacterium]